MNHDPASGDPEPAPIADAPAGAPSQRRPERRPRRERSSVPSQPTFGPLRYHQPYQTVLTDEQMHTIHDASLKVLNEIGMEILHPRARQLMASHGARVDGLMVYFDPEMVEEYRRRAPSSFQLHGRGPGRTYTIGDHHLVNSTVSSTPNYVDLDGIRKTGDRYGYRRFLQLAQSLTAINMVGGFPVEPIDVHPSIRHLDAAYDAYTLTDMSFCVYSLSPQRLADGLEMARIARGVTHEEFDQQPSIWTVVNANSPLRYDTPMLEGVFRLGERNQPVCFTPFTLAGAMAPITLAGAIAQQNAEALAGITIAQAANPGAPVIYGGFTSNVDMRSGAPAFGTPEYTKAAIIGGQMARFYGLPYRSSNVSTSNTVDAQAGYESTWALWGAIGGGANVILHGAGWMEGGLHASYEKMVIDADLLNMAATFMQPVDTSDEALGLDAMARVGPGGHFLADPHTGSRYTEEFLMPMVSDWRNWETWEEAGSPTAQQRANTIARRLLKQYEPPPMDDAIHAELHDFVERRKAEGGIPTDF